MEVLYVISNWEEILNECKKRFPYREEMGKSKVNRQRLKRRKFLQGAEFVLGKKLSLSIDINGNLND